MSPENSEDGNYPAVADALQAPAAPFAPTPAYHQLSSQPDVSFALSTSHLQQQKQQQQQQQQFPQFMPKAELDEINAANKRRRIETTNTAASMMMTTGPQLVTAAAQVMEMRQPKKSQAQLDRRRERNRILARRTRLRKKFFFESLQKEVMDLQRENESLKDLVRNNIDGEKQKEILDACDANEKMPPGVLEACGELDRMELQDFNLVKSIQKSQHSFIITDPSLTDNPIVFASDDFLKLTGYTREQVLGRNCRFLQGTDTSIAEVNKIRKGLANGEDVSVTLINYTAAGTPFWNKLFIGALRDAQNNIVNYIGVIVEVAGPEPGHPDHGVSLPRKNQESVDGEEEDDEDAAYFMPSTSTATAF